MRLFSLSICLLLLFLGEPIKAYGGECFGQHLRESIEINKQRKKFYSNLTNGESNRIFNFLIISERISLLPAYYFDKKSKVYHENGIPLFCDEFMPMNISEEFMPEEFLIPEDEFGKFELKKYTEKLNWAIRNKNSYLVKKVSLDAIRDLEKYPSYYCMTRHILESIFRFIYFLPMQEQKSLDQSLKSPKNLVYKVISLHNLALKSSMLIDKWSAPIQKMGIPILCSELPKLLDDLLID